MEIKAHWEEVYRSKRADEVSWFQPEATLSLNFIRQVAPHRAATVLDVGGGASTLVDGLLAAGYTGVTVLDLSAAAMEQARQRLGESASRVTWTEGDALTARLHPHAVDVWHDRAVFHFLTAADDRARYVEQVRAAVRPGGHMLVATFAEDGPTRSSGLPASRYSAASLHAEFGAGFRLLQTTREEHRTPDGRTQAFVYCLCQLTPNLSLHSAG